MSSCPNSFCLVRWVSQTVMIRASQVMRWIKVCLHARMALAAEHLFLQHQIALYQARNAPSRRAMHATRLILVWLSYWFDWQPALTIVRPETFKRWRRQGWRLLWKAPSKPGRPQAPLELQALIRRMARENLTWGQQRIANELLLKLGLRVSPRTVRKYMPHNCGGGLGQHGPSQRWSTFIRNHARGLMCGDGHAKLVRGMCLVFAHTIRLVQWQRERCHRPASGPAAPLHRVAVAHCGGTGALGTVQPLHRASCLRGVERGPPARARSRQPHSLPVVHTLPVVRGDVRGVPVESCWRSITSFQRYGVQAPITGAIWSAPLQRAA
jgi:hypothetical protein